MSDIQYRRLPKELKHPVKTAMDNGWRIIQATSNGYRIESPGKSENYYVPIKTKDGKAEARVLMRKVTRAVANEDTPQSRRVLAELNDPASTNATLECAHCDVEFVTTDGYNAHLGACIEAARARLAAEQEAGRAITPPEAESPPQAIPGYVNQQFKPVPPHRPDIPAKTAEDPSKSSGSGKIGNKEEDNMGGIKRGPYNRREVVKSGLARALYEAMRKRSQHRDEALSVYANVIADMIQESGVDFDGLSVLDGAEGKLASIIDILGVDLDLMARAEALAAENERITSNLKSLRELLGDIK